MVNVADSMASTMKVCSENNYWIKMQSENIPTDEEINSKVDDYRSYFIQYITQKNSSLVDQKIREGLRVDLKNLQPQA